MATPNKIKILATSAGAIAVEQKKKKGRVSQCKERFRSFASVTTNNQFYMTPRDFIDSLTGIEQNKQYIGISEYEQKYFNNSTFNKQLIDFKNEYAATGSFSEVFNRVNDQGLLAYCDYGKV
jgi:hypothetical protein